jgi:hypothetical protein
MEGSSHYLSAILSRNLPAWTEETHKYITAGVGYDLVDIRTKYLPNMSLHRYVYASDTVHLAQKGTFPKMCPKLSVREPASWTSVSPEVYNASFLSI